MTSLNTSSIHLLLCILLGFVTTVRIIDVDNTSKNILPLYIDKSVHVKFNTLKFISKEVVKVLCWLCVYAICMFYYESNHSFVKTQFEIFILESLRLQLAVLLAYGNTVAAKENKIFIAIHLTVLFSLYMVSNIGQDVLGSKVEEALVLLEMHLIASNILGFNENNHPKIEDLVLCVCVYCLFTFSDIIYKSLSILPSIDTKLFHVIGCTWSIWGLLVFAQNGENRRLPFLVGSTYPVLLIVYHVIYLLCFIVTGCHDLINTVQTFIIDSVTSLMLLPLVILVSCKTKFVHILDILSLLCLFVFIGIWHLPSEFLYLKDTDDQTLLIPPENTTFIYKFIPVNYFVLSSFSILVILLLVVLPELTEDFKHTALLATQKIVVFCICIVLGYYLAYISNMIFYYGTFTFHK